MSEKIDELFAVVGFIVVLILAILTISAGSGFIPQ